MIFVSLSGVLSLEVDTWQGLEVPIKDTQHVQIKSGGGACGRDLPLNI